MLMQYNEGILEDWIASVCWVYWNHVDIPSYTIKFMAIPLENTWVYVSDTTCRQDPLMQRTTINNMYPQG